MEVSRSRDLRGEVQLRICTVDGIRRRRVVVDHAELVRRQISLSSEVHGRRPQLVDVRLLGTGHKLLNRCLRSILDRSTLLVTLIVDHHGLADSSLKVEVVRLDVQRDHLRVGVELAVDLSTEVGTSTAVHNPHHGPSDTRLAPRLVRCGSEQHRNESHGAGTIDGSINSPVSKELFTGQSDVPVLVVHDLDQRVALPVPLVDREACTEPARDTRVPDARRITRTEAPRNDLRLTSVGVASCEGHEVAPVDEHALETLVELRQEAGLIELLIQPGVVLRLRGQHIPLKLDSIGQGADSLPTPAEDGDEALVLRINGDAQVLELLLSCVVSPASPVPLFLVLDLLLHQDQIVVLFLFEPTDHRYTFTFLETGIPSDSSMPIRIAATRAIHAITMA